MFGVIAFFTPIYTLMLLPQVFVSSVYLPNCFEKDHLTTRLVIFISYFKKIDGKVASILVGH